MVVSELGLDRAPRPRVCLRPTRTLRCEDLSHSHGSSTRWPTGSTTGWPRVLCARSCVSQPGCCRAHAEDEHSGRGRVGGGWCPGGERGAGGRRPWARWLRAARRRPDVVSAVMTTRFATAVRTHGASSVSARAPSRLCRLRRRAQPVRPALHTHGPRDRPHPAREVWRHRHARQRATDVLAPQPPQVRPDQRPEPAAVAASDLRQGRGRRGECRSTPRLDAGRRREWVPKGAA